MFLTGDASVIPKGLQCGDERCFPGSAGANHHDFS